MPNDKYGYLNNWYYSNFIIDGIKFNSVEQYMAYMKATVFGDTIIAERVLQTIIFSDMRELSRMVKGYDENTWNNIKYNIAKKGIYAKFSQNPELRKRLIGTGESLLAACSIHDTTWGIGMSQLNKNRYNPSYWKGENLLGKALMEVRTLLRSQKH